MKTPPLPPSVSSSPPSSLAQGTAIIKNVVRTLPETPGVYRMFNSQGEPLYVGKAKNLKKRVLSYTSVMKLPRRLQRMVSETCSLEIVTTGTETEALLLESNLVKKLQPRYNILLKDDKSFPHILITQDHDFPRIEKHRGSINRNGKYFGPFASVAAVEETMILLQKVFLLRSCSDSFFKNRHRPCFLYHIKRCSAPCVGKISREDYASLVKKSLDFLKGKTREIQEYLAERMQQASHKQAFEDAVQYRDRLRIITHLQAHQRINVSGIRDCDVIATATQGGQTCVQIFFFRQGRNLGTTSFFLSNTTDSSLDDQMAAFISQFYQNRVPAALVLLSHKPAELALISHALQEQCGKPSKWEIPKLGAKRDMVDHALSNAQDALRRKFAETTAFKALFKEISEIFQLSHVPDRIEIYDNSHLQGSHPYGVMVVATREGFDKKSYRKFAIKAPALPQGGDDYAMMREVLQRRFAHAGEKNWILPDLVLIDGGAGQLGIANEVIEEMNLKSVIAVGIAKGSDRNAGRERFFQADRDVFTLPENSPVMHFLQRLRDEAHRFAIGTHRAKRAKALIQSRLDTIEGIGPSRKKALLNHFGSSRTVSSASLQELQAVPGINKSVAKKIHAYFHET